MSEQIQMGGWLEVTSLVQKFWVSLLSPFTKASLQIQEVKCVSFSQWLIWKLCLLYMYQEYRGKWLSLSLPMPVSLQFEASTCPVLCTVPLHRCVFEHWGDRFAPCNPTGLCPLGVYYIHTWGGASLIVSLGACDCMLGVVFERRQLSFAKAK